MRIEKLTRREREIMDAIYALDDNATAEQIRERLSDPPSYSAVRAMLRLLEEKNYIRHEQDGMKYIYLPTVSREKARQSALKQLVQTFFDGSTEQAVAAMIDMSRAKMSDDELNRLSEMIELARKEGR